jgi:iron complex transport system ATP-binding protein
MPEVHCTDDDHHEHVGRFAAQAHDIVLQRGSHVAVASSRFAIPAGVITAIIGPNGSGKSTILHAIAGLLEPTSGSLTVLGATPTTESSRVAYVLQSPSIPTGTPLTVQETVAMGRYTGLGLFGRRHSEDRQRVQEAMELLAITDLRRRHLSELSGGQRQRVFVAQGVAQDHDLLLLDEPLTGLDIVSARTIDDIIHSEPARGCSVILTTHDLEEAEAADHVVLMSGRVVASGPPDEVLTRDNLAEAYGLGALHRRRDDAVRYPTEHPLDEPPQGA